MKSGLAKTLDQMVRRAAAHPGLPVRQPLGKGLRVDVMLQGDETYLQISRDNVWPSATEWSTVTRLFPSLVPNLTVTRIFDHGRYYLKANWKTVVVEQPELLR